MANILYHMLSFKMASTSRTVQNEIVSPTIVARYRCLSLGPEILPKSDWIKKIRTHLQENFKGNEISTSCQMIKSLNDPQAASECIKTIQAYLKNIKEHPDNEKYKKISLKNKIYLEKVANVEGAFEFLTASGFQMEGDFLKFEKGDLDLSLQTLDATDAIKLELDRNLKVFKQEASVDEFPDEFYEYSLASMRREHERREKKSKVESQLRTKAMRDEKKEVKIYEFTVIRVRFPDGLFLQGTFEVTEPFHHVRDFVSDSLAFQTHFEFRAPCGQHLDQNANEKSLLTLNLVPAVVLNIKFDMNSNGNFIKADLIKK